MKTTLGISYLLAFILAFSAFSYSQNAADALPLGSWENFIFHFYDADGVEMETFFPKSEDEKEKSGFYILENERKVVFEGLC